MANQRRLADNASGYEAGCAGAPRKGTALLQGVAICGRCGRRMSLRYTGPMAIVRSIAADLTGTSGASPCAKKCGPYPLTRSLKAFSSTPSPRIGLRFAAMGQLEEESRQLERQWALRRERARYEAERTRRQYDAVEPENRLVARSLERVWEEKLRAIEEIDQEHARWRSEEPLVLHEADHASLQALGENLPRIWRATTTSAADRKRILRFIVREMILDQKRPHGQVWLKIVWQTGATSEHCLPRRVHAYRDHVDLDGLQRQNHAPQCRGQDGQGDRGNPESRRLCRGARLRIQGRQCLVAAQPLGHCNGKNQRRRPQPTAVAARQLFDPGRRRSPRRGAADDFRLSCPRPPGGPSIDKGSAVANRPLSGTN